MVRKSRSEIRECAMLPDMRLALLFVDQTNQRRRRHCKLAMRRLPARTQSPLPPIVSCYVVTRTVKAERDERLDLGQTSCARRICSLTRSRYFEAVNVRFWHKADISRLSPNVRFRGQSGHDADVPQCPLLTQSGHHSPLQQGPSYFLI
jgi:hypothetical protein